MLTFTHKDLLKKALRRRQKNGKIGFVPTMGALHSGHISLVKRALSDSDTVVVSIFVNPTQFDSNADLEKYPRSPEDDISLLETLNSDIIVYLPAVIDLYPEKVVAKSYNFGGLEYEMEGKHRDGHFDGVGTIVAKLFRIVMPDSAYFGEKDFQQLQIVKKLVEIEKLPIQIIGCPISREKTGLAKSSRNERLTNDQLDEASIIYKTLMEVREKFDSLSLKELNDLVEERFLKTPSLKLEYFEIANEATLKTVSMKNPDLKYRGFIAAFAGEVRLIDNMTLN